MKTFIIVSAIMAIASAAIAPTPRPYRPAVQPVHHPVPHSAGGEIPILRQASDIQADGSYSYSYETGNGIAASESGVGGQHAQGDARWVAPDGTPIEFQYVADENGYQPTGSHIPQIPPQIARALEYIRAHPYHEDQHQYQQARKSPYNKY